MVEELAEDAAPRMTPAQARTFNELLVVGGERPTAPVGLVEEISAKVAEGTAEALDRWTERSLWLSKAQMFTALRCEGQLVAEAAQTRKPGTMFAATAVGIVAHRAIQLSYTHKNRTVDDYVRYALSAAMDEESFETYWHSIEPGTQSDLLMQASTRVVSFLDDWPALDRTWTPRFEEPIQAKIGKLTLSCRADLILGRPRPDGRQTMFLADFKSGALHEHHDDEAAFYALVCALRHGVPPFRSTVYSLASGTYTDPDVTAPVLHRAADQIIEAVRRICDVLTDRREPVLTADAHCTWCPAKDTCPAYAALSSETGS